MPIKPLSIQHYSCKSCGYLFKINLIMQLLETLFKKEQPVSCPKCKSFNVSKLIY